MFRLCTLVLCLCVAYNAAQARSVASAGSDMVAAVEARYEAVKKNATQLVESLNAAVTAGKLTLEQIQYVRFYLLLDEQQSDLINSQLLVAVGNCWMFIDVPGGLDACQIGAAGSVMMAVAQLESTFKVHQASALGLLGN
ncbi:uncharacterized protein LOC113215249 isoform X2 [Frankliniella occidentalis]|uniref:Uncharacterized protein LOC113215249 isoform X2 n=1 Tax=Frankliniella occidentalis TaxID=133901 RepID=A0A6J1TFW2_FRAOC|nr:uncharacterized protein LOC113215249 isoform X2 [Frankliniella occidentalis]